VDSDDWIPEDFVSRLYAAIMTTDAQIAIGKTMMVHDEDEIARNKVIEVFDCGIFSNKEIIAACLNYRLLHSAWGKLFNKDLFEGIRFPVGKLY
jgi:hypothetical protein